MAKIAGGGDGDFEDGPCESAKFNGPSGIALASDGSLLIADSNNRRLRKISVSAGSDGSSIVAGGDGSERRSRAGTAGGPVAFDSVTTIVGNGDPGYSDGRGEIAALCDPYGVVCDSHGNVFLTDAASHTVRRVSSSGEITLVAGREGRPGFQEGRGNQAAFEFPYGIALGPDGTLFVADSGNHRIRAVSQQGDVKTFAGNGHAGYKDGTGSSAQFYYPVGIAVDADGTVFVTDRANHRVRKITSKGTVSTLAGNGRNAVVDGKGQSACFAWPHAITLDPTGRGPIYVSDTFSFRIRRIQRDGQTRTLAIGKAPPPAPAKVPPAPAAPAEASASAMSADATGTAEAPAVPATAEQAPSKAHGGAEAPPCPPEANPNGTAVEASTGAPPALDGPVPMEQESTVSAGAKEVDGCSAPDAAAPKADGAAAPAEPLAAAAASSAAVPNGDAESEDAHEAGVMPPAEQPVKQEAAEAPPADVPIPAPPPPATSASAADAPPEASSSELSTSAAPESATAAASQVGEGAAATTSWAPPSQPTAEAPTGPSAGAHAPAAAPALPSATAMPAAEGAAPTEGAQPTGAAAPAPTEAAAPSEPPGVAKPADAAMAPAAAPAPAPAAASAAPAEPVRTSLISTDEHAINGLIFLTLDAERSLLYVSEQSNHRVRCLSINGPVTMTS